jgi:hypothetical protein
VLAGECWRASVGGRVNWLRDLATSSNDDDGKFFQQCALVVAVRGLFSMDAALLNVVPTRRLDEVTHRGRLQTHFLPPSTSCLHPLASRFTDVFVQYNRSSIFYCSGSFVWNMSQWCTLEELLRVNEIELRLRKHCFYWERGYEGIK